MTDAENRIFRDAFRFFSAHSSPPPVADSEASLAWWEAAAKDIGEVSARWQNHPLMDKLLIAIYEYLEQKAKEAGTNESSPKS